ncbi:MAG: hypothetical protein ACKVQU_17840 [Burkholderiales bacterium]
MLGFIAWNFMHSEAVDVRREAPLIAAGSRQSVLAGSLRDGEVRLTPVHRVTWRHASMNSKCQVHGFVADQTGNAERGHSAYDWHGIERGLARAADWSAQINSRVPSE